MSEKYNARRNRNYIRAKQRKALLRGREWLGSTGSGIPPFRHIKPLRPKEGPQEENQEQPTDTEA